MRRQKLQQELPLIQIGVLWGQKSIMKCSTGNKQTSLSINIVQTDLYSANGQSPRNGDDILCKRVAVTGKNSDLQLLVEGTLVTRLR